MILIAVRVFEIGGGVCDPGRLSFQMWRPTGNPLAVRSGSAFLIVREWDESGKLSFKTSAISEIERED